MNDEIEQLKRELEELKAWKKSLEMSHSIPLNIDQAFRKRLNAEDKILKWGFFTTVGGDASETITGLDGVKSDDVAIVTLKGYGATPRTILASNAAKDSVEITFSGDPSSDHVVNYVVIRK